MTGAAFLDTSVLVRLFDDDEPQRQAAARAVVGAADGPPLAVSAQVLAEFHHVVTTGLARPLASVTARRALADLADLHVVPTDTDLVLALSLIHI